MQKRWLRGIGLVLGLAIWLAGSSGMVAAQDGGESEDVSTFPLTLLSVDAEFPARFELLAPDGEPTVRGLRPNLTVNAEDIPAKPLLYVAVENTGWSQGAIGLISDALDPDAAYVALEVRDLGMAGYVVREDGQALVFPLHYEDDLDGEGTPGFRFDILIGAIQTLRVFRVVDENGLMLFARESTLTNAGRVQERVTVMIDPDPIFGELIFECHIEALPDQGEPVASPPELTTDSDGDGIADVNDACPDQWGGLPNGCMANEGGAVTASASEPTSTPGIWIAE